MLKFKRVKPKFSDHNNNLAVKPTVVRARLVQGYPLSSVASFDKLNTATMYCYAVSYIEITDVVVFFLTDNYFRSLYRYDPHATGKFVNFVSVVALLFLASLNFDSSVSYRV